jgi:hypothetical protein
VLKEKGMMKRVLFGLFAAVMVATAGCDLDAGEPDKNRQQGQPEPEGNFTVVNNGPGVTITSYTGLAADPVIPGRIDGLPVTVIGDGAFAGNALTRVTIGNEAASIGSSAFPGNGFAAACAEGGAGTYTCGGSNWVKGGQAPEPVFMRKRTAAAVPFRNGGWA